MIELRPHQADVVEKLEQGFAQHRCQLLYAPTGFGKTEVAMHIMVQEAKKGVKVAMVLDRIVLVNQTSARLSKYKINHGVMQAGHWRDRPFERIQVCSAQTLERRDDFPDVGLLIIDECFVAGTHIATPKGPVMIDHVRCGDLVYNQGGIGVVEAVSIKPATQTYRLEFDDGTVTQCTGNHPFFTERGWRAACQLEIGAYTFGLEGMRLLWESVQTLDSSGRERQNQVGYAGAELEYAAQLLNILLEEVAEPHEQPSNAPESESQAARDQAQTHQARRERAITSLASACVAARLGKGVGVGVSSSYKNGAALRLSQLLQAGLGKPHPNDRGRDRRLFPHDHRQEESRSEEDGSSCFPRLVGVSLIKRPSAVSVFNLQVSGHPSYFADGRLVHNCHVQREKVLEFIKEHPKIRVIGLTATPFTNGLGSTYTHVVGAKPTGQLIEEKWLVPLKIFIAKEIDMTGVKKVAGEWSQDETTKRGMQITGDIVDEWINKTNQLFGGPKKTVVFASGVEHGRDLVRQFNERGYNFVSISYKEDDDFKRETIEDFSAPDTKIHGLIATDILTRGFDVPDVLIGVSARPFSKSFSSHVQQMGRIMRPCDGKTHGIWLCMAKGSLVLTDSGLVPIDKVKITHKIWDGTNFVTHGGAICNGIQEVITYQGLTATAGHLVHTAKGWRTFGECANQQIRITQTGLGGQAIRLGSDLRPASFLVGRTAAKIYSCFMRVHGLWLQKPDKSEQFAIRKNQGMPGVQSAGCLVPNVAIQPSAGNEGALRQSNSQPLLGVRRSRGEVQVFRGQGGHGLDFAQLGFAGVQNSSRAFAHPTGQDRPGWALRAWKFAMAFCGIESAKQARKSVSSSNAQVQDGSPGNSICGQHLKAFLLGWYDGRADCRKVQPALHKTKREVWDILDSGPNNRFTCEGLLVHNCHSGNYLRFRKEWDSLFEEGVTELNDGAESTKKEPTEKKKKDSKCGSCGALWIWPDRVCGECGWTRPMKEVLNVPGHMVELETGQKNFVAENQQFYSELLYYARMRGYKEGWAAYKYKDKFGVFPRGLGTAVKSPSFKTLQWLKSQTIALARSRA